MSKIFQFLVEFILGSHILDDRVEGLSLKSASLKPAVIRELKNRERYKYGPVNKGFLKCKNDAGMKRGKIVPYHIPMIPREFLKNSRRADGFTEGQGE